MNESTLNWDTGSIGNKMSKTKELPLTPVIVIHLEDPPGSGLAACCGIPFQLTDEYLNIPRWLCTGCSNKKNF